MFLVFLKLKNISDWTKNLTPNQTFIYFNFIWTKNIKSFTEIKNEYV